MPIFKEKEKFRFSDYEIYKTSGMYSSSFNPKK